jgi:type IV pilus assembly protein PilC
MPSFEYIALDSNGEESTGVVEADTDSDAIDQLRRDGLYPTKVVDLAVGGIGDAERKKTKARSRSRKRKGKVAASGKVKKGKIKGKSVMIFTRQLATLIDSGLPLMRSLTILGNQEPNPVFKQNIAAISDAVQSGSTFSESLTQFPQIFNKLYINMVKAGELGGVLELVLNRLAEYQEKAQKLKNKIVAAMVYPLIVMFIAVAITVFLLVVIVPKFEKIFIDMLGSADKLPGLTKLVVGASRNMASNIIPIGIGLAVVVVIWRMFAATQQGKIIIDKVKLKIPVFGDVQMKSAVSRFARTLGTLVTSGVPILQALNITKETAGNLIISRAIGKVHDAVKEGESIVAPLDSTKVFPPMVVSMIDVGEETGQLPEMLLRVADVYDDEVDAAVTALTSMLEPMMIVILAVVVGTIVLALFLPLIEIIKQLA